MALLGEPRSGSPGIDRRSLLGRGLFGAVALALTGGARASARAGSGPPEGVTFSADLGPRAFAREGGAAAAGATWLTSGPLRAPKRFDLLGLSWKAAGPAAPEVRARLERGRWSRWIPLRSAAGHRPDGAPQFAGSEPVWFGGADLYEIRVRRAAPGLRVHFVNSTGTATAADRRRSLLRRALAGAAALRTVRVAPGAPAIIPRSAWAGRGARPSAPPLFGNVELAFVHHTDSANGYGPGDSAAMILSIFHFHRDVRGWDDIGYNFVVDRFGQVFEGRAGGMLEPVVGAQAGGFNTYSTGVAALGTFMDVSLNARATDALARLLAWKLTYHGVPVLGHVTVTYQGSADKYRHGARVRLNRIAGHRDGNATDCPGDALYARLPSLRSLVARYASGQPRPAGEAAPTLAASTARAKARTPILVAGSPGAVAGALTVLVERQDGNSYVRDVTAQVRPAGGRFAIAVRLPRRGRYRITARGTDARGLTLRSAPVYVTSTA